MSNWIEELTPSREWIRRVMITGGTGSGARYLIEYLQKEQPQVEIHATARRKNAKRAPQGVTLHEVDLLDTASIINCFQRLLPDAIFHLAANPDKGFEIPSAMLMNNAVGSANLFEAARLCYGVHQELPVIISASTSEIYGAVRPEEVPIREDCPKRPCSPYGVSKLAQDCLGKVYFDAYGMNIITTRAFTYNNFYRTNLFSSSFAQQIALIEAGKQKVLRHGNLDSVRVMCDASSIAEAYWLAAVRCRPGEVYNIGGDKQVTVGDVLQRLIRKASVPIHTEVNPDLLRPVDVTLQIPDCSKFRAETGWEPTFDLDASLHGLLEYWRQEVKKG